MEDPESGETPLKLKPLDILAEKHDGIINSRTEQEILGGNPEKGFAVMKLMHAASYLVQQSIDEAHAGHGMNK